MQLLKHCFWYIGTGQVTGYYAQFHLIHECVESPFKYSHYNIDKTFMQNVHNISRNMIVFQVLLYFLTIILRESQFFLNAVFQKRQ